MATKTRHLTMPFRVDYFERYTDRWMAIARFSIQSDAIEFARAALYRLRRVAEGRRIVASYSGKYIPPSGAAGDRANGEGTGALEH